MKWNIEELNGYKPITTFWQDFTIVDSYGVSGIKDTYKRAFEEWKSDYKYLTELIKGDYMNYNIIDNGETQIGKVIDIVEHLRNEISRQALDKDNNIEELYYNIKLILDLLEDLANEFTDLNEYEDTIIEVRYNPMGCYEYVKYEKVEEE